MASRSPVVRLQQRGIQKICATASRVVRLATTLLADPEKMGGYFCLLDRKTGVILIMTIIGSVDPSKAARYKRLAEEKALRLFDFRLNFSHISSRVSANEAEDKWPGSVLGNRFIYSFSGFPPTYDEAISLATAFKTNDMPADRAESIMFASSRRASEVMSHPARVIIKSLEKL